MREKNFTPECRSHSARGRICEKNRIKILKIKKPLSGIILAKTGWDGTRKRKKKNLVPNSVPTQPELENTKKKI